MGRPFRLIALVLSFMLLTGMPANAGPIVISDVIQVINGPQNPADIQLQNMHTPTAGAADQGKQSAASATTETANSVLSGIDVNSDPQGRIEVIDLGEVEGTICDCGGIWVPGGFPKWPLLFLAGIPFFFTDDDIPPTASTPPPGPTPPPTPVPEPASLLLFGTGLVAFGAGLRRRYSKKKLAQTQSVEEGQSL